MTRADAIAIRQMFLFGARQLAFVASCEWADPDERHRAIFYGRQCFEIFLEADAFVRESAGV